MFSVKKFVSVAAAVCVMAVSSVTLAATDISSGKIVVEGIGGAGQTVSNGYRAAIVDAQRLIAEEVHGVQIDSDTTVENSILTSDIIKTKVKGVIKGAKVVSRSVDGNGYYHVVMELPVYGGANSLAAAVLPQVPQQGFLPPSDIIPVDKIAGVALKPESTGTNAAAPTVPATQVPAVNQATVGNLYGATGHYTGLIVDCSGMGLQTAMAPAVFTEGRKVVYGLENFSHDQVINRGYVGYSKSLTSGVERAGSNPMIVKAESIDKFCSPVVSKEDAAKILAENQMNGFLSTGNVVFVK